MWIQFSATAYVLLIILSTLFQFRTTNIKLTDISCKAFVGNYLHSLTVGNPFEHNQHIISQVFFSTAKHVPNYSPPSIDNKSIDAYYIKHKPIKELYETPRQKTRTKTKSSPQKANNRFFTAHFSPATLRPGSPWLRFITGFTRIRVRCRHL